MGGKILFKRFPFLNDNIFLCAWVNKETGREKLIMQYINPETDWIMLEEKITCIHTAICDISANKLQSNANSEDFYSNILELRSSEHLEEINLSAEEKFKALKSWVAGIAEAGLEAIHIQSQIESYARLMYPLADKILKFLVKIDPIWIFEIINKIERNCIYEGVKYDSYIIVNLIPLLKKAHYLTQDLQNELIRRVFDLLEDASYYTNPKYPELWSLLSYDEAIHLKNFESLFSIDNIKIKKILSMNEAVLPKYLHYLQTKFPNNCESPLLSSLIKKVDKPLFQIESDQEYNPSFSLRNNHVSKISLKKCQLSNIPNEIFEFNDLNMLDCSFNMISEISPLINKLQNLVRLDLSNNQITERNFKLEGLDSLRFLNLSN
ncbi:MAG: hypothetical protein GF364_00810, partial [Candidatus Lokiarchaeota archaeon]|nr:hypothetical protein [Candidatus Lokiarchaeota archaeon]